MLYGRENCHGGDIYAGDVRLDFSASVSPLGTPKSVIDALTRVLPELYHYPDPRCRALVQAIAEFERVPQERILCGAGASELIYTYCEAVRPKRAMVLAPTFSEYAIALQRTGCEIVRHTNGRMFSVGKCVPVFSCVLPNSCGRKDIPLMLHAKRQRKKRSEC